MRNELSDIANIEAYLLQIMSDSERNLFEQKMNADASLAQSVKLQKVIIDRINFNAFKAEMMLNKPTLIGAKKSFWTRNFYLNSVLILVGIFTAAFVASNIFTDDETPTTVNNQAIVENDLPNKNLQITTAKNYSTPQKARSIGPNLASHSKRKSNQKFEFSKFKQKFNVAKIIAENGGTIITKDSKSNITIPANILVDEQGNLITGEVEIKYREYRNAAEMAFSGIPMFYNENEVDYKFNSAGMIEVRAYQNGKELQVKPNSDFTIDYNVTAPLDDCYFFALDDKTQEWEKKQKIDFPKSGNGDRETNELSSEKGKMDRKYRGALTGTIAPLWISDKEFKRSSGAMNMEISGASVYLYYPLDYEKRDRQPAYRASEVVSGYQILDIDTGRYVAEIMCEGHEKIVVRSLTIYADKRTELNAKLVRLDRLEDRNFNAIRMFFRKRKAQTDMRQRTSNYELLDSVSFAPNSRNVIVDDSKDSIIRAESKVPRVNPNSAAIFASTVLVQGLRCENFGVYNCDQIQRIQNQISINGQYKTKDRKPILKALTLVLIDLGINAAFSFAPLNFKCERKGKNTLLLFTGDQKIFALSPEKFNDMNITRGGSYYFEMTEITEQIKGSADLKNFLGI